MLDSRLSDRQNSSSTTCVFILSCIAIDMSTRIESKININLPCYLIYLQLFLAGCVGLYFSATRRVAFSGSIKAFILKVRKSINEKGKAHQTINTFGFPRNLPQGNRN